MVVFFERYVLNLILEIYEIKFHLLLFIVKLETRENPGKFVISIQPSGHLFFSLKNITHHGEGGNLSKEEIGMF